MSGNHSHFNFGLGNSTQIKIALTLFLNLAITIGQFIGGLLSGSMALMSDAAHNFSDVISLILSLIANKLSHRKSSREKTYGYKRAEIIAAFVNSSSLIAISVYIFIEALSRIKQPEFIESNLVIYFAIASIVINLLSVLILHNDSKNNLNIKSSYLHLLTDVMTSVAVLIGGLAMKYFEIFWIDTLLSMAISIYLLISSFELITESLHVLMQFSPKDLDLDQLNTEISSLPGIHGIHHVHVWSLDDRSTIFEAHIELEENMSIIEFNQKLELVHQILFKYGIDHINLQPEINRCVDRGEIVANH